jgi:inhibitor of KinA
MSEGNNGQIDMQGVTLYPLGDAAIVLQFGDVINRATHLAIQAFTAALEEHPFAGFREYVPAFTTVTVYYDPWIVSRKGLEDPYENVRQSLQQVLYQVKTYPADTRIRFVDIPVCYGGKWGPDLELVAALNEISSQEVIRLHAREEYLVYMLGFAPGFPYLEGMSDRIAAARKDKPRARVPAGSVGIAGKQTGIYSIPSPGGWQLIGRTPLVLFDPRRESPSLLQAGDHIRFVPITEKEYEQRKEQAHGA